jgi:predicted ATPase
MPLFGSRKKDGVDAPRISLSSVGKKAAHTGRSSSVSSVGTCGTTSGVSEEFMQIVKNELKPTVHDKNHNSRDGFTLDKLNLTDLGLYGRSSELAQLLEAFESLNTSDSKMVSILGSSGTGKSTLAQQLQGPVTQSGGFFITGKFDIQQRVEPYTAFVNAFTELCDTILARDELKREEVMEKIKEALGSDGKALTDVIPGLQKIIGEQKDEADAGSMETRNRLHFLFRQFTRAVCSPSNPLVLVLDDVQWADASSLELIETLVTDVDNSSLLLVVTSRDNETKERHPFTELLQSIQKAEVTNRKINLGNLDCRAVNCVTAVLLRSTEDVTKPLADIIHGKTLGNAFFVIEFIKSLVDESLLSFNFGTLRWHWKKDQIQAVVVTDNVADLMTAKLQKLPPTCRLSLEVAACLGQSFVEGTLGFVMEAVLESDLFPEHGSIEVGEMMERSVIDGLLEHEGLRQAAEGPTYSFVHDQVQNAALALIPIDKRPRLELLIGQKLLVLYEGAPHDESDSRLFVAVDLCNRGVSFLGNEEKIKLAEYNAIAGKKVNISTVVPPSLQELA